MLLQASYICIVYIAIHKWYVQSDNATIALSTVFSPNVNNIIKNQYIASYVRIPCIITNQLFIEIFLLW